MKIIDAHTHPRMGIFGAKRPEIDALVSDSRSLGIELMVGLGDVLRHGSHPTASQISAINDDSARLQSWHPEYFRSLCFVNPTLGERAVSREVDRCLAKPGFVGIKLEICNNARDACMRWVMAAAQRWHVPVLQHTWSIARRPRATRRFHSDPADTALLGRRYPGVTVIMAHLSGCETRGILEIKDLPNVVVDTSGGTPVEGLIEYAVDQLGANRVLYGSDLPGRSAAVAVARVLGSRLSEDEKKKVLFSNAQRVYRLGPATP